MYDVLVSENRNRKYCVFKNGMFLRSFATGRDARRYIDDMKNDNTLFNYSTFNLDLVNNITDSENQYMKYLRDQKRNVATASSETVQHSGQPEQPPTPVVVEQPVPEPAPAPAPEPVVEQPVPEPAPEPAPAPEPVDEQPAFDCDAEEVDEDECIVYADEEPLPEEQPAEDATMPYMDPMMLLNLAAAAAAAAPPPPPTFDYNQFFQDQSSVLGQYCAYQTNVAQSLSTEYNAKLNHLASQYEAKIQQLHHDHIVAQREIVEKVTASYTAQMREMFETLDARILAAIDTRMSDIRTTVIDTTKVSTEVTKVYADATNANMVKLLAATKKDIIEAQGPLHNVVDDIAEDVEATLNNAIAINTKMTRIQENMTLMDRMAELMNRSMGLMENAVGLLNNIKGGMITLPACLRRRFPTA
jgi:hypothetical protein